MVVTKEQAAKCGTHHYACDCREYKYQKMEHTLKVIGAWASNPEISGLSTEPNLNGVRYDPKEATVKVITALLRGIESWAADEDGGVHPGCWVAYKKAKSYVGE